MLSTYFKGEEEKEKQMFETRMEIGGRCGRSRTTWEQYINGLKGKEENKFEL